MPQMDPGKPFSNPRNAQLMDIVRGVAGNDYQQRVPSATKASVQDAFNAMWDVEVTRNQFIDALVNRIGTVLVKYNTWTNPLAKYKRGLLNYGESIEEVAIGLLNAYHYSHNREYLERDIFGKEPNEVQSRFHKINREDYYKLTVNQMTLKRAFLNEGGLSQFLTGLMSQINTSDQQDEFLLMSRLFKIYDDEGGFYNQQVPDISSLSSTSNDAKQFLKVVRSMSDTLPFMSRAYNAAHMPVAAQRDQLELIITPNAQANIDVEALSAAFNEDKARMNARITVLPEKYIGIADFQALLTTKDFFIVADNLLEMRQSQNPVGLHTNFFWHHWETISASPFVPAIKFTTQETTPIIIEDTRVDGISAFVLRDGTGTIVTSAERGDAVLVQVSAVTVDADAPDNSTGVVLTLAGRTSTRTRITQTGILFVADDEAATSLKVTATSTSDPSYEKSITIPLTGDLLVGSVGMSIDTDVTTLSNTRRPGISPQGGPVGTVFSTTNGSWDQEPDSFTYAWKRDGVAISGATSSTYTAVDADNTHDLSVAVTAVKSGFANVTAPDSNAVTVAAAGS